MRQLSPARTHSTCGALQFWSVRSVSGFGGTFGAVNRSQLVNLCPETGVSILARTRSSSTLEIGYDSIGQKFSNAKFASLVACAPIRKVARKTVANARPTATASVRILSRDGAGTNPLASTDRLPSTFGDRWKCFKPRTTINPAATASTAAKAGMPKIKKGASAVLDIVCSTSRAGADNKASEQHRLHINLLRIYLWLGWNGY